MKKTTTMISLAVIASTTTAAQAAHMFEDYAKVLDVTPQYEEVNVPRHECVSDTILEPAQRRGSVAGPVVGGVAGGIIGAQVGKGNGRVAASAAGALIGAIVGDRMSDRGNDRYYEREVQRCRNVDHWETRLSGYRVVYRYRGQTETTILPYDPGRRLRVRVAVEPAGTPAETDERWED